MSEVTAQDVAEKSAMKKKQSAAEMPKPAEGSAPINASAHTPLYHQAYLVLRDRIVGGDYPFNTVLPSEAKLCEEFDVSRITIRRALNELAEEGYVTRQQGRGTTVCYEMHARAPKANFDGLIENLLIVGKRTEIELLAFEMRKAEAIVASALELREGDPVQYVVRRRRLSGAPFSHVVSYVPGDIAKGIGRKDLSAKPLLAILEARGVHMTSARQTVTAVAASPDLASALEVEVGVPLTRVTRIVHDQNKRAVEYIVAHYRPDKYVFEINLRRAEDFHEKKWIT